MLCCRSIKIILYTLTPSKVSEDMSADTSADASADASADVPGRISCP